MDISATNAIERVARVIAAQRISSNADGTDPHAGTRVDAVWRDHRDDAVAILKALREPDADMERAGDIAIWQRMISAALGGDGVAAQPAIESPAPGTDPLHEGP